jgi:hypothetical protein
MANWRIWFRAGVAVCLGLIVIEQLWRHGRDYVLPRQFAVVVPGKIYRGGWQRHWPMRQIACEYKIRTILALAHPDDHPLSSSERALAQELGIRWIHIPIVEQRATADARPLADQLDEAAAVLADSRNYPIFFHCHHGLNRASMAQIAYRTKYCGWTLDQATDEIAHTVGLVKVTHGPDYRRMVEYYNERVLPLRESGSALRPYRESAAGVAAAPATATAAMIR